MANNGLQGWLKLKKVVDGGEFDGQALDIDNNLVTISGLPQDIKDNLESNPDYVEPIENLNACPLPTPEFYTIGLYEQFQGSGTDTLIYAQIRDENGDPVNATVDIIAQGIWNSLNLSTSVETPKSSNLNFTIGNNRIDIETYDNTTTSCNDYHVVDIFPNEMNGVNILGT